MDNRCANLQRRRFLQSRLSRRQTMIVCKQSASMEEKGSSAPSEESEKETCDWKTERVRNGDKVKQPIVRGGEYACILRK
jgi:hypothetical protein